VVVEAAVALVLAALLAVLAVAVLVEMQTQQELLAQQT
jgi:type II secretory pathway component PulJ